MGASYIPSPSTVATAFATSFIGEAVSAQELPNVDCGLIVKKGKKTHYYNFRVKKILLTFAF